MNIKRKLNDALEQIKASDELDKRVMNSTIYKEQKKMSFSKYKLAYSFCIFILVMFISSTVVLAATYIYKYVLNVRQDSEGNYEQTLVVKEPVNINDVDNYRCSKGNSLEEIGENLGIKFMNNNKYNDIIDKCDVQINEEGKIESMSLYIYDYVDYSKENKKIKGYDDDFDNNVSGYLKGKHIGLTISFMTQNASNDVKEKFTNLNMVETGTEMEIKEIKFNDLNIIAHSYSPIRPEKNRFFTYVVFVHNNIVYTFQGYRVSVEDIINVIQ